MKVNEPSASEAFQQAQYGLPGLTGHGMAVAAMQQLKIPALAKDDIYFIYITIKKCKKLLL